MTNDNAPVEAPTIDLDNVPETLCFGKFNLHINGALATITFTHSRPLASNMMDQSEIILESVVRARIVTSVDNLVELRNALNTMLGAPDQVKQ